MSELYRRFEGKNDFSREGCRFEVGGGESRILSSESTNRANLRRGEGREESFDGQDSFPEFRARQERRGGEDVRGDEGARGVEQSDVALLDRLAVVDLRTESEIAGEWIRGTATYGVVFQRDEPNQRSPRHAAAIWWERNQFRQVGNLWGRKSPAAIRDGKRGDLGENRS